MAIISAPAQQADLDRKKAELLEKFIELILTKYEDDIWTTDAQQLSVYTDGIPKEFLDYLHSRFIMEQPHKITETYKKYIMDSCNAFHAGKKGNI